jgi:hypothetical protein
VKKNIARQLSDFARNIDCGMLDDLIMVQAKIAAK